MLVTGKRDKQIYKPEEKSEEVSRKFYFSEPYISVPKFKIDGDVECLLDQTEAPYRSCTVKGTVSGIVNFGEVKNVDSNFTIKVSGYH